MQSTGSEIISVDRHSLQQQLLQVPRVQLGEYPTPVTEMSRLRAALGGGPRLLIKRDDVIPFACGGNKVRKLEMVIARALADGADTIITTGSVQSSRARVTAAAAAVMGLDCVLVLNGGPTGTGSTGNTRLMELFGARLEFVADRRDRAPRVAQVADDLRASGRRPFVVSLGASTGLGALGLMHGVRELLSQVDAPDVIVLASSSGGTQAGVVGGCLLYDTHTRVIGVSADDPADEIARTAASLFVQAVALLGDGAPEGTLSATFDVTDRYVGDGYGQSTPASRHAAQLAATCEALVLDPVYTAKALAALIADVKADRFSTDQTVLFWHTGGLPGFFA